MKRPLLLCIYFFCLAPGTWSQNHLPPVFEIQNDTADYQRVATLLQGRLSAKPTRQGTGLELKLIMIL